MIDFDLINRAALGNFPAVLARVLPAGRAIGNEWIARNPRRDDKRPGSFKVNLRSGLWCDFATGDKGGDPVSLIAYLQGLRQLQAARLLGEMLGISEVANGR